MYLFGIKGLRFLILVSSDVKRLKDGFWIWIELQESSRLDSRAGHLQHIRLKLLFQIQNHKCPALKMPPFAHGLLKQHASSKKMMDRKW